MLLSDPCVRMVEDEQDPCCAPAENGRLPAEIWLLILEHLDLATQTVVAGTCRYCKSFCTFSRDLQVLQEFLYF